MRRAVPAETRRICRHCVGLDREARSTRRRAEWVAGWSMRRHRIFVGRVHAVMRERCAVSSCRAIKAKAGPRAWGALHLRPGHARRFGDLDVQWPVSLACSVARGHACVKDSLHSPGRVGVAGVDACCHARRWSRRPGRCGTESGATKPQTPVYPGFRLYVLRSLWSVWALPLRREASSFLACCYADRACVPARRLAAGAARPATGTRSEPRGASTRSKRQARPTAASSSLRGQRSSRSQGCLR